MISLIAARCAGDSRDRWNGAQLAAGLSMAAAWLRVHTERLNGLNVYPVPDGDTGTNLSLTLDAAAEAAQQATGGAAEVARAAAHAALMGSRGNSGVILSQCLSGFAQGLHAAEEIGPAELCAGLRQAVARAYASVAEPVEGTLLTAAREAAEAVASAAPTTALEALRIAARAAGESVERSPQRLPLLRPAGVVDAGAEGLRVILEALLAAAEGRPLDPATVPAPPPGVLARARAVQGVRELGYCTEFLVRGAAAAPEQARAVIRTLGTSVIVVAEADALRVHLHTEHPGTALETALTFGRLDAVKIEDMERQHQAHTAPEAPTPSARTAVGIVAVVSGAGFQALYTDLGALVVDGGQTMNPSVEQLVAALRAAPPGPAVLLPNHPNVVAAARQAAALSGRAVEVLDSTSQAQGISAMLAVGPEGGPAEAIQRMREALRRVRTIELAQATRAANVQGVCVQPGAYLARLDGRVVASGEDGVATLLQAIRAAAPEQCELATLYVGEGVSQELIDQAQAQLQAERPDLAVEVVPGGQPHYPLLVTLE